MKTSTKIAVIVAFSLITVGILLWGVSFMAAHGDWNEYRVDTDTYVQKTAEYDSEQVKTLILADSFRDVELVRSQDEHITVTYEEGEKTGCDLSLSEDGTLTIDSYSNRKWYEWFSLSFGTESRKTVIAIPENYAGDIKIQLSSSDFQASDLSLAGTLSVTSASGDILLSDMEIANALTLQSTSGNIRLLSCKAEEADVRLSSGDIKIETFDSTRLACTAASGDIDIRDTECSGDLSLVSTSGNLRLRDSNIAGDASLESTSGDIKWQYTRARDIKLVSTSGDVRAEILGSASDYHIDTKTTSGTVRVPDADGSEKHLRVETVSGDIRVSFSMEEPES